MEKKKIEIILRFKTFIVSTHVNLYKKVLSDKKRSIYYEHMKKLYF